MTSFGRTKVKKTSKSDQVYRIRESLFSKGLQGYTRVSLAIKKIPDNETLRQVKVEKTQYLCGFADLGIRQNRTPYTKLTPFDVGKCAEAEKSHN